MMVRKLLIGCMFLCGWLLPSQAQWSVRNNLLYDAALTPNLSGEVRIKPKWTLALNLGFSPFETGTSSTRRWRHVMVMPEARYWFCEAYSHHFLSVNGVYSHYNASKLDLPLYGTKDFRYQGDFVGAGLSYGYAVPIGKNNHWNIEFEVGADLCYTWYDKYACEHCGGRIGSEHKFFVLPKAAISLAWILPHKYFNKNRAHACDEVEEPVLLPEPVAEPVVAPFVPVLEYVQDNTGQAGRLQSENPILAHISEYQPYDDSRILRKERKALYVFFPLDSTVLRREYRDNAQTLDRIMDISRQILSDSISTVKKIQIIGMASIEGTIGHNQELGEGRGLALKRYVQDHLDRPVPDDLFEVANAGEAWTEFRDQINDLRILKQGGKVEAEPGTPTAAALEAITPQLLSGISVKELDEVLRLIDEEPDEQRREWLIGLLNEGRTWNFLRHNILADQRNSGYLRIYYDYVPDEAAKAINKATDLLRDKQYQEALGILQTVKSDSRAWNALATALYMTGQKDQALSYFRRAAADGNRQAKENLKGLGIRE